jgi:hypothetical protein
MAPRVRLLCGTLLAICGSMVMLLRFHSGDIASTATVGNGETVRADFARADFARVNGLRTSTRRDLARLRRRVAVQHHPIFCFLARAPWCARPFLRIPGVVLTRERRPVDVHVPPYLEEGASLG